MSKMIFVNLPTRDLTRARRFYQGIGYTINERFSDETGFCVVVSDAIYFMILTVDRFAGFSPRPVADTRTTTSALVALMADSRHDVDQFRDRVVMHGGMDNDKTQDHGFMYSHSLSDPDGNVIEIFWMDPAMDPAATGEATDPSPPSPNQPVVG